MNQKSGLQNNSTPLSASIKAIIKTRHPKGKLRTEAFFCTNLEAAEMQILRWFILRWNIEVTFEELRA
ncbi:MAG: hypothetical protein U9Q89_06200, partial [Thermodesulfobacteriota bacterium]|nr:hypothetical protein [Thermodesulfobacteriota bacterium]